MISKKSLLIIAILAALGIVLYLVASRSTDNIENNQKENPITKEVTSPNMKLVSSAFEDQSNIPSKYTCDDKNISPPLSISQVPQKAKSLLLIVDDPDAPAGDWTHWLVWNIDPQLTQISEGEAPADAVEGLNDFGSNNYGGPCPPSGKHRYQFKLYALDTLLDLPSTSKKQELLEAIKDHILEQIVLVGFYQRN